MKLVPWRCEGCGRRVGDMALAPGSEIEVWCPRCGFHNHWCQPSSATFDELVRLLKQNGIEVLRRPESLD